MPTLVLATSGPLAEVGLAVGSAPSTRRLEAGAARGRGLLPAIDALLREQGLSPRDLLRVVVDVGPGSFTGVRVGVTTAKTLAFALGLPLVAVTSLAALAACAPAEREVLSVRDAGRGRLYAARYAPGAPGRRAVLAAPARVTAREAASLGRGAVAVGEGAPALLGPPVWPGEALDRAADVAAVLVAAEPALAAGEYVPPHVLAPVYLQASAPERRRAGEVDDPA